MSRFLKAIIALIVTLAPVACIVFCPTTRATSELSYSHYQPATAIADNVETTFFGEIKDDGKGCGVYMVLNLILDILSIGIGIVAVVGIMITGIRYLTARGNEQNATKARQRFFQVIIGLVAYVMLYSAINFLLPGGKLNSSTKCPSQSTSSK